MTENITSVGSGSSNPGPQTMKEVKPRKSKRKSNTWKHRMYELEIAIAKESNPRKKNELIKIYNSYIGEYDSLRKQIIWLAVLGACFLVVLAVFAYFLWDSYNSENMSYNASKVHETIQVLSLMSKL